MMAREYHLPPSAASLSESLRDLGYSLETAIADLIDNSISANATAIRIFCDLTAEEPLLAIIDDGDGMSSEELIQAMRHGSSHSRTERMPTDLGRFGLGLKTASFSQCRRLTVVSVQNNVTSAAEWDLKSVSEHDDWIISILDQSEIEALPFTQEIEHQGTLVLWRDLDRLTEEQSGKRRSEVVNEKLDTVERHLSLVFHRFLSGEIRGRKKLAITLNGHSIQAFDPFCRKNAATQVMPEEIVRLDDYVIRMQPFILPHHSKLTASEYDFYQDRSDFISNQGAYIYRNGRLMAWGDWFRLIPKGESTKLARVQIDFPNALDETWTIDIKKSRARPPYQVRERLRQILARISERSTVVHRGRGKKLYDEVSAPVWDRFAEKGSIHYEINSDHPLIKSILQTLNEDQGKQFSTVLQLISASLPVEMIYSDYSTHPADMTQLNFEESELKDKLEMLKRILFDDNSFDADAFEEVARSTRIFENHNDIIQEFIRKAV